MSMNIFIQATRKIQVIKTGRITEQSMNFSAWQTPTQVTMQILNSTDPAAEYRAWAQAASEDYTVAVFAEDDVWEEGEPIGTKTCNDGLQHANEFEQWLRMCEDEGYEVKFHMI
jgi:hypothetical protein